MRVTFEELYQEFLRVLLDKGFEGERARLCARLFTETSLDGYQSHGINRFPRFIDRIDNGYVKVEAHPEQVDEIGNIERWDGNLGPGNLNAYFIMEKAIDKAKKEGIAVFALRHTNHWMRGGTYGWQAADEGCGAICMTNTLPNMPPWGAKDCRIGNNPLVMAIPREEKHVVLDMAMSLYSYGKLTDYDRENKRLPFPGGYDTNGKLRRDPGEILEAVRPLPMGYWKGSGLSIMLDMFSSLLSSGLSTFDVGKKPVEYSLSQLFLVFDMSDKINRDTLEQTVDYIHEAEPAEPGQNIYYPGERTYLRRQENRKKGIPVDEANWNKVKRM